MEDQQNQQAEALFLPRIDIPGSRLPFRWQGFMIYFFMWIYGGFLILNAIPMFDGVELAALEESLTLRYMPNFAVFPVLMGIVLLALGAAVIVCRFLLARYKRCALPVFFAVSVADILLPLLFPLGMYWAMQPWSRLIPLGSYYSAFFTSERHFQMLYPLLIRLVLLLGHSVYYFKRRIDFTN